MITCFSVSQRTRYLSYETKSINIISCYIHYREILRQELFLGMITLCLENGIRQKLKVWKAILKSRKSIWKISQEKYYLQKYQEGDSQAKNILIEHNLRLVAHVVKKYQGTGEDTDDLISIGTIGLIKAVTTFNPQKASRLSTYAARCIENELLMYFRAKKKHSKEVSLYEPIGTDKEGNEINLLDVIESAPVDIVEDCYIRENTDYLLRSLKKVLSDKEYQVICCRYGLFGMEEETQREIARKLCISRSYVSRIEKTALQKLRGLFPQMQ